MYQYVSTLATNLDVDAKQKLKQLEKYENSRTLLSKGAVGSGKAKEGNAQRNGGERSEWSAGQRDTHTVSILCATWWQNPEPHSH